MKKVFLLLLTCFCFLAGKAQIYTNDSISPWIISLGIGYYLADDDPALYYGGADNNRFYSVFENTSPNNQLRNQLIQDLDGYEFTVRSYPSDLRYRNVASFQLAAIYQLNRNWSVDLSFHNVRLTSTGVFTLTVNRVISGSPEPFIETGSIRGEEARSHITIGGGYSYDLKQNWYLKGDLGINFSVVEVTENIASVAGRDYSIQFSLQNLQTSGNNTFGTGFYSTATLGYHIPQKFGIALKMNYINSSINLNDVIEDNSHIFVPTFAFTKGF